jgi:AcrR family transcriptional regulator
MSSAEPEPRPVGRPRNENAGPRIRRKTRELVVRRGYENVTTAMIAAAAGVSKQTIYRRWPTKAELVLEAFLDHAKSAVDQKALPQRHRGKETLIRFLNRTFEALQETGPAIRSLMAWAQYDPEFRRSFRERFIEPRRSMLRSVIALAIPGDRGARSDAAIDTAVMAVYGAVWYRLLLDEPFDPAFAQRLTDVVIEGLATGSA